MPLREGRRQRVHDLAHALGHLQRVGIRQLVDADDGGRYAVELAGTRVVGGGELDAGDVLEVDDGAVGAGAHDDVAVFLGRATDVPSPRRRTASAARGRGLGADGAGGRHHVLLGEDVA